VPVALDAEFDFSRGRVELRRVVARTPGLEAKLQGAVRWGATRDVDLAFTASGSTDVLVALGYVTDVEFIRRYTDETDSRIFPIAAIADERMLVELKELVATRREYLARRFEI